MKRVVGAIALLLVPLVFVRAELAAEILNHLHHPEFAPGPSIPFLALIAVYFVAAGLWWFKPFETNIMIKIFVVLAQVAVIFVMALVAGGV